MPSNANTIDTQQVLANSSNAPAKYRAPKWHFQPASPMRPPTQSSTPPFSQARPRSPCQTRDGTAPLSFVPIGGTFIKDTATPQTEPTNPPVTNKDGEDHAPSPLALSPIQWQSEKSASPPPLPTPPRPQPDHESRANSVHSSVLTDLIQIGNVTARKTCPPSGGGSRPSSEFRAVHNRYPGGFSLPGLAKAAPLIARLVKMTEPPRHAADYMTDFDIRYRVDVTLARGLKAVLPQLEEYLDMDDSRDVLKRTDPRYPKRG